MTEQWIDIAPRAAVPELCAISVMAAGHEIALYEVDGAIFATDNLCTHGAARLTDGFLEGSEIECPLHQGRFDVCTGEAMCAPLTSDIRTYPVQIKDERIWLQIQS